MSAEHGDGSEDDSGDDSPGRREVAYRVFAAEFDDSDYDYSESDADRAPNYVVTPTGARVNRLFAVGVLTEVSPAGEDVLRARIADPTGTFVVYAGQYQPDAQTFLERAEPPAYVAVTGKARTFQPEDSDVVYTSIRPESLNEVDEVTRDRWTVGAAEATLERVGTMATAMELDARGDDLRAALEERGVEPGLAAGIPLALEHYETTSGYLAALRTLATSALEVVTGERDEVEALSLSPDEGGDADLAELAGTATVGGADQPAVGTGEQPETTASTDRPATTDETLSTDRPATTDETPSTAEDTASTPEGASSESEPATEDRPSSATTEASSATTEASSATTDASSVVDAAGTEESTTPEPATETAGVDREAETDTGETPTDDSTDATSEDAGGIGDFDGEFELDEDEREQIKDEFGTEFTSGTDVSEPGEAGIETPDEPIEPGSDTDVEGTADEETATVDETLDDGAVESTAGATGSGEPASATEVEESAGEGTTDDVADDSADEETDAVAADTEDVDLEDAAMDAMTTLDDGDGADREAVVERVRDAHGVEAAAVEDAIQDALMSGRCYEPSDGTLKSI